MKSRIDLKLNKISRLEIPRPKRNLRCSNSFGESFMSFEKLKESIYELDQKLEGKQRDYQI